MTTLANPLVSGFNPDPSVTCVDGVYYLATSTFEYLPGIPVYRSADFATWEHIGNVVTSAEQGGLADVATAGGVWAPTIRHRNGVFYVIVTIAMSPRGCVVYTATDPAGPWSEGTTIDGVPGIDPDLAWDEDGTAYVTFSGLVLTGEELGRHNGIQQVRVDLEAGKALEAPRSLWSGTGLKFPEAPHLYRRGEWWYLMIAEGGTERGHGVSVARSQSPEGPFEGHPGNPLLSARSTSRPIQNTGHADLVDLPDGSSALVLLGMRPLGATQAFSPLGRETFATPVDWVDGWPVPRPVELGAPGPDVEEVFDLRRPDALDDPGWLAVRQAPADVARPEPGGLALTGTGATLADPRPVFLGRRQRHLVTTTSCRLDASAGVGGLACRYDEESWLAVEAAADSGRTRVTARASIPTLSQTWEAELPAGEVELRIETVLPSGVMAFGADRIRLVAAAGGSEVVLTELDGRSWTAETCASFTGRVSGMYAVTGTVSFAEFRYSGSDG